MNKIRFTLKAFAFLAFTIACATAAQAQATRTWVSGVGDDVNPCSRTAPCKTFAGAISKTAAGGEIDCLDPGGFGTVTITKNLTIDGTTGAGFGSILSAGTTGVNINDGATATPNSIVVALRNLSINGAGTGFDGIRMTFGKTLHIEDCVIAGFKGNGANSDGIDINLTTGNNQSVKIKNTVIRDCTANGIRVVHTGGTVFVTMDGVHSDANQNGLGTGPGARVQAANSYFTFNTNAGVHLNTGTVEVDIDTCFIESNNNGILATAGTGRIANCRISGNTNGINFAGGTVNSFGDNKVKGNVSNDQVGGSVTLLPNPIKI
jgi:hypothetical protein